MTSGTHDPDERLPGQLPPLAANLFRLAKELARFADEQVELLSFEEYSTLCEQETKLLAYGNLLSARNRDDFLESELSEATECLGWLRERLAVPMD